MAARQFTVLYLPRAGSTEFEVLTARSLDKHGKVNDGEIAKATGSVRFAGLEPGSRIEYAYRRRYRAGNGLGAFSRLLTLALNYPQQKLKLTLSVPKALRLNFKYGNLPAVPQFKEETGPYNRAYVLEFANLPGCVPVPWLPADRLFHPYLRMSALKEWQEFTDWYAKLIEGSDTAGSDVEQLAARLAQGANSDAEKLEKLYDYVNALRYDTTPIGIRGLRPRLPGQVIESGYGDCKDKATLLVALAGKLGIEGYTALLNRAGAADPNFPSWQFNHMLAYFPELEGFPEGLWLDATDTETPFPTLPPGDVNRPALVLTPAGGAFRTVKPGRPEANQLTQNFIFERGRDGQFTFNAPGHLQIPRAARLQAQTGRTARLSAAIGAGGADPRRRFENLPARRRGHLRHTGTGRNAARRAAARLPVEALRAARPEPAGRAERWPAFHFPADRFHSGVRQTGTGRRLERERRAADGRSDPLRRGERPL